MDYDLSFHRSDIHSGTAKHSSSYTLVLPPEPGSSSWLCLSADGNCIATRTNYDHLQTTSCRPIAPRLLVAPQPREHQTRGGGLELLVERRGRARVALLLRRPPSLQGGGLRAARWLRHRSAPRRHRARRAIIRRFHL